MISSRKKMLLGLALLIACAVWIFSTPVRPTVAFKEELIYISRGSQMWPYTVAIAETGEQQRQGLMYRRHIDDNYGMLFINKEPQIMNMWMKNTFIPLDMLFLDRKGYIVNIIENATPDSTDIITYDQPVAALLELPAGAVKDKGIVTGDRVIHSRTMFRPRPK